MNYEIEHESERDSKWQKRAKRGKFPVPEESWEKWERARENVVMQTDLHREGEPSNIRESRETSAENVEMLIVLINETGK